MASLLKNFERNQYSVVVTKYTFVGTQYTYLILKIYSLVWIFVKVVCSAATVN